MKGVDCNNCCFGNAVVYQLFFYRVGGERAKSPQNYLHVIVAA